MHGQRIAVILAAAVGGLATFLPWVNVAFSSVSGLQWQSKIGDHEVPAGWGTLAACALTMLLALGGKRSGPLRSRLASVIAGAAIAGGAIWNIVEVQALQGAGGLVAPSVGVGLYLLAVAGVAVIGVSLWGPKSAPQTK